MANKASFKKGERKRNQGGRRPGAGRKSKEQKVREEATEKRLRDEMFKHGWKILDEYIRIAKGGKMKKGQSPATLRHAIDKLLPPLEKVQHTGNVTYVTNLPKPTK